MSIRKGWTLFRRKDVPASIEAASDRLLQECKTRTSEKVYLTLPTGRLAWAKKRCLR